MQTLFYELERRKKELERAIAIAKGVISKAPPGKLRLTSSHGCRQYISVQEEPKGKEKYMGKSQMSQIEKLANKEYAELFLRAAIRELNDIDRYLNKYLLDNPETVYTNLHKARRFLATPILIPDDIYVEMWLNETFDANTFHPEELIYQTKRGDLVRSKSEAFLADIYYELNIPYRYEAPVQLKDGSVKYPDFTSLRICDRQEIYHEHLGLLDDAVYRRDNFHKIMLYSENGIVLGKNLILTFEAAGSPFNAKTARKMIKEVMNL